MADSFEFNGDGEQMQREHTQFQKAKAAIEFEIAKNGDLPGIQPKIGEMAFVKHFISKLSSSPRENILKEKPKIGEMAFVKHFISKLSSSPRENILKEKQDYLAITGTASGARPATYPAQTINASPTFSLRPLPSPPTKPFMEKSPQLLSKLEIGASLLGTTEVFKPLRSLCNQERKNLAKECLNVILGQGDVSHRSYFGNVNSEEKNRPIIINLDNQTVYVIGSDRNGVGGHVLVRHNLKQVGVTCSFSSPDRTLVYIGRSTDFGRKAVALRLNTDEDVQNILEHFRIYTQTHDLLPYH